MTDTTHYYRIHNRRSGVDLGVFSGADEAAAIRAMLLDANSHTTEPDPDLVAIGVEPLPETLDALHEALVDMLDRVGDHVDDDPRLPTLTLEDLVRDRWGIDITALEAEVEMWLESRGLLLGLLLGGEYRMSPPE